MMIILDEAQRNLNLDSGGTDINFFTHVCIFSITNPLDKQALLLLHIHTDLTDQSINFTYDI